MWLLKPLVDKKDLQKQRISVWFGGVLCLIVQALKRVEIQKQKYVIFPL